VTRRAAADLPGGRSPIPPATCPATSQRKLHIREPTAAPSELLKGFDLE
jgi:hypothetical protein